MKTKNSVERAVEKWLEQNGFTYEMVKQYLSKTVYNVKKDGVSDRIELSCGITNVRKYMDKYNQSFEMKRELINLRKECKGL